ncbi:alpha/beta fold hydrolase [Pseudacidovorax intermedius]|uniref:Alpha/beta hydrolase n=1 Tax=Pseudacidovorax intermedius TaxID=433924 RepID=A0A147HBS3_9BURK|nr:alpha/beta fold hydrolase [Pseudacidovorax intermedius]KTT27501.1 alpha/beta hydrolase [Pseudacidovorax intermedius]
MPADTPARLVFLPGLACDERLWAAQLPAMPDALRPRVADVSRRHGSIEAMARALLDEEEGPLLLAGASMGGMVAMEAARQAPERVAGLALLGTSPLPETPEMHALRSAAIEEFAAGRAEAVIRANVAFAFHPANAADPALVQRYLAMVLDAGAEQLIRQNRAVMVRPDARLHLGGLRCPVLLMCGEADRLTPPDCTRAMAALVLQAEVVWLPEAGHMLTMECPDAVNAALLRWLAPFLR